MVYSSISAGKSPPPPPNDTLDWEIRTDGMFVRRDDVSVGDHSDGRMIKITVSHGSSLHDLYLPAESTFGDIKKLVALKTGLEPKEQRLFFRGKEKQDEEDLHLEGVKDKSEMFLLEDAASEERKLEEIRKQFEMLKASEAVAGVRAEVDQLSERIAALEVAVNGGTKIADNEFIMLAELLMRQLLKLDSIEAEGEAKLQRKAEVRRVQNFVDTLDSLKERNSKPFTFSEMTRETYDSGMESLNAPHLVSSSGEVTQDLEQFDCSGNKQFELGGTEQSMDLNTSRALARKWAKLSKKPLDLGAQVQDEQSVGNETIRPKDPQISHQTEANKWTERGTTSGTSNVENSIAITQPEVHFDNEGSTTKDVQAQIEGEIIKEVVSPENPQLPKQIKTGIDEINFGGGGFWNVIPQAVAQTNETTDECPAGVVLTPTDSPVEITCKNFLHPTQGGVLDDRFLAPAPSNTPPMGERPQGASPVDVEVASGEHHSLTSPRPLIAGESSLRANPVIGCPVVGRQALQYPSPAIYCPPLGQIIQAHSSASEDSSEKATYVNVGEVLRLISPSSTFSASHFMVDPPSTPGSPPSPATNVARSVAVLCGLDTGATKLMEIAFNKYPNLMIIRSDRRERYIRWIFCSLSDLLQLLSTVSSSGTLDMPKMREIEVLLRELETFEFDAGFIYETRLQVREAWEAINNANLDLKTLCSKAEGLSSGIASMERCLAAAKAEVAQVEAKINTLCDFVEENRTTVFKWIQLD